MILNRLVFTLAPILQLSFTIMKTQEICSTKTSSQAKSDKNLNNNSQYS